MRSEWRQCVGECFGAGVGTGVQYVEHAWAGCLCLRCCGEDAAGDEAAEGGAAEVHICKYEGRTVVCET